MTTDNTTRPDAAQGDWKNVPMSEKRERLEVHRSFTQIEWEQIRRGLLPIEMEDKWFIYQENNRLHFHRSWTGFCIYTAMFENCDAGVDLVDAWVCRDPEQYTCDDPEEDRETLYQLIDILLAQDPSKASKRNAGFVVESVSPNTMHTFSKIDYNKLNTRQQESYNFQKVSAVLADYGFTTMRLSDDWQGADFIAQHQSGEFLKVQLKGRLCIYAKYQDKNLYVCCPFEDGWLIYPHDELLAKVLRITTIAATDSWAKGGYSWPSIPTDILHLIEPYRLPKR